MKTFRTILLFFFAALPIALHAQATIPVTGQKVVDNNMKPLTGQLLFTVTDSTDTPITYTPQGGSATSATITIPVVRGAVQNVGGFPAQIPNPATMTPANSVYRLQVQSTGGGTTYFTFPLVNISQAFFSYDAYTVPTGVTATGMGLPHIPCAPHAQYNNTLASDPYPWVCSQATGDTTVYWTQNPSLNPACARGNDQAIASYLTGGTSCIDASQAFVTPGFVWAGPPAGAKATQIGLTPIAQLCSGGVCGTGSPPAAPQFAVQYAGPSAAAFNADPTFNFNPTTHALSSAVDNSVYQANQPGIAGVQATINTANTTGSVIIPLSNPLLLPGPTSTSTAVTATGGHLGVGTFSYLVCTVSGVVEQQCSPLTAVITSGTTNIVSLRFAFVTGMTYNIYGRVLGTLGFIKNAASSGAATDDGSISPGAAYVASYSNPNNISVDDLRYGPLTHYATGVPVRNYCSISVESNSGDATACIQAAINYAQIHGIRWVDLSPNGTYHLGVGGFFPWPWDNGACPTGSTVNGAPCTTITAETPEMQAYSLLLPSNVGIRFNGAEVVGDYSFSNVMTDAQLLNSPVAIVCADSVTVTNTGIPNYAGCSNSQLPDAHVLHMWMGFVSPGTFSFGNLNIQCDSCGFIGIVHIWDSSTFGTIQGNAVEAGLINGGWYTNRANSGSNVAGNFIESGGYADGMVGTLIRASGQGSFVTNRDRTDGFFYAHIYKGQNQATRMVDVQGTSSPNGPNSLNTIIPYRGVFGITTALYGRYARQNNGEYIQSIQSKSMARYNLYAGASVSSSYFGPEGAEGDGVCGSFIVGDPVNCPDPWGYGTITPALLNFGGGAAFTVIVGVGSDANHLAGIAGAGSSTTIMGAVTVTPQTTAPNQISIPGGIHVTAGLDTPSGQLIFSKEIATAPGGSVPAGVEIWTAQQVDNLATSIGGYLDWTHANIPGATGFAFRVPYLAIATNPQEPCDAPISGYAGHRGWINYIAGPSSSVADIAQICTKDASGAYAWHSILGGSGGSYTLPQATTTTLGGVKVDGTSVTINPSTGVISATGGGSFTPPTGTGFFHITGGAADSAARAVNLATGDVTGLLPLANLASIASTNLSDTASLARLSSPLTTGYLPRASSAGTIEASHLDDGATTSGVITSTEPISVPSLAVSGTGFPIYSGTLANTDGVGDLTFSASTAQSYTFTSVPALTNHPICTPSPEATTATSGQPFVTYTGATSFTINFPTAFTGNVGYTCIGRN